MFYHPTSPLLFLVVNPCCHLSNLHRRWEVIIFGLRRSAVTQSGVKYCLPCGAFFFNFLAQRVCVTSHLWPLTPLVRRSAAGRGGRTGPLHPGVPRLRRRAAGPRWRARAGQRRPQGEEELVSDGDLSALSELSGSVGQEEDKSPHAKTLMML